ncbi:PutR transcriptional activator of PutA and PutP [Vibrio astriarenae]|nr:PutR transcriptional activator of PutA and PutP [Vibrio sp. C7]
MELDRTDKEILRLLHLKGRLPVVELAKQVNLTTSPCSERVKRLEKEGFITGYHAELSQKSWVWMFRCLFISD